MRFGGPLRAPCAGLNRVRFRDADSTRGGYSEEVLLGSRPGTTGGLRHEDR